MTSPEDKQHAARRAVLDDDLPHLGAGADLDAALRRGLRHRLRDGAHAAQRMTPDARLSVHLAKAMVEQDVGSAGRGRRRVGTDDAVEGEGGLDRLVLEPLGEEIRRAFREQVDDEALILDRELQDGARYGGALDQLHEAAAGIGRRLEHKLGAARCGAFERGVVGRQAFGIVG